MRGRRPDVSDVIDYVGGLAHNLYATAMVNSSLPLADNAVRPTQFQSLVHSVHFYPFVIVVEKTESPVSEYTSQKHGTLWQPWIFRQRHVIEASGGTDRRCIVEYSHELPGQSQVGGLVEAEPGSLEEVP